MTAANKSDAAALAARYGFGAVIGSAPAPVKQRKTMSFGAARALYQVAHDWPSHGAGWPSTNREREADAVLAANDFDPED